MASSAYYMLVSLVMLMLTSMPHGDGIRSLDIAYLVSAQEVV